LSITSVYYLPVASTFRGKNELAPTRHQHLHFLKSSFQEVTNFLETDSIKVQDLGKTAKEYCFSGKGS
jgi:hypothetical protein